MITVKDVLDIPALRRLIVVGGEQGLGKRVSYVTVMEVPDIIRWLKGNDFVITSFFAFKDDIEKQIELIDRLADANCSCLAIKTGQYVKQLDKALIDRANARGLVLVEIPNEVTYIEILYNAMNKIFENRDIDFIIEKYMKDIIFNNYDDYEMTISKGNVLGFDVLNTYSFIITLNSSKKITDKEIKVLRGVAKGVAKESDNLLKFTYNPVVTIGERSSIIFLANEKTDIKHNINEILNLINNYIIKSGLRDIYVGIGPVGKGFNGIKESYIKSVEVLKVEKFIKNKSQIYFYDDMKTYLMLEKLLRTDGDEIFNSLYKAFDTDLLITLEAFYENDMDVVKTAEQLFIHKNTVRYRLKKIKELTGYDTDNFEHNFNLYLFLLYTKIK